MSTFLLNVPLTKILRCHCTTGLEWNSCMKFCSMFPPRTKILELLLVQLYIVHYSCTRAVQYLNERKMGMQIFCNYIDFAVIFQKKLYSTNFIIHWLRAGPGRKQNFAGPAGPEISTRLTSLVMYYSLDYLRTAVRQRILVFVEELHASLKKK